MPKKTEPKPKKDKSEDRMDKLIIADMEKLIADGYPEYARSFKRLYDEYNRVRNDAEDARKSEREAWAQNNSLTIELNAKRNEADNLNTSMSRFQDMWSEQNMKYNDLKMRVDMAELREALAMGSLLELQTSNQRLNAQLSASYGDIPERVREELMRNTQVITNSVNTVINSLKGTVQQPTVITTPTTVVKEEKK